MSIIFGFGSAHKSKAKEAVRAMAEIIDNQKNIQQVAKKFAESLGLFKDEYPLMHIQRVHQWSDWHPHWGCVIEGQYNCYRDDHPMSPDGMALMGLPFNITIQDDDIYGRKEYISI